MTTIGITCNELAGSCRVFDLSRRGVAKAEPLARGGATCYNTDVSKLELRFNYKLVQSYYGVCASLTTSASALEVRERNTTVNEGLITCSKCGHEYELSDALTRL